VTRLFLSPLLAAFSRLIGEDPYIRYLASFRYALSGEFTVQRDLASRMRLPSDWGLEIVSLFEALRHRAAVRICQVEIADRYDHKHQTLSDDDPSRGLNRMARDVATHLLRTLAAAGVVLSAGLLESLQAAYQREAEDAVADSYAVAAINGLVHDRHQEELNLRTFGGALRAAIDEFHRTLSGRRWCPTGRGCGRDARIRAAVDGGRPSGGIGASGEAPALTFGHRGGCRGPHPAAGRGRRHPSRHPSRLLMSSSRPWQTRTSTSAPPAGSV